MAIYKADLTDYTITVEDTPRGARIERTMKPASRYEALQDLTWTCDGKSALEWIALQDFPEDYRPV